MFKENKKWGSRDRRFFAESFYDIIRFARTLAAQSGLSQEIFLKPLAADLALSTTLWRDEHSWRILSQHLRTLSQEIPDWFPKSPSPSFSDLSFQERHSLGEELHQIGLQQLETEWSRLAPQLNSQAPVFLRVNILKTDIVRLSQTLMAEKISTQRLGGETLLLEERRNVFLTKPFREGWFEVQDLSSQQVAHFLQVESGQSVIDACAGAGGKSLHLAALMKNKGKILSLDIFQGKLQELRQRAQRNGVDIIETRLLEDSKSIGELEESCDRLLLDVPCTGSGVLRRNPEGKYRIGFQNLKELEQKQREILSSYSRMLKPGGLLVYSTCSLFPSENQGQVCWFMEYMKAKHPDQDWELEAEKFCHPGDPEAWDGFFMARFRRNR